MLTGALERVARNHVRMSGRFFQSEHGSDAGIGAFEIIEPGVVWMARWRPDPGTRPAGRPNSLYGGVGRKPGARPRTAEPGRIAPQAGAGGRYSYTAGNARLYGSLGIEGTTA